MNRASEHDLQLVSAERLAELLDVSIRTLWRLRSAGKLPPPLRIGSAVRWPLTTIHEWMAAGCPAADSLCDRHKHR